MVNEIGVVLTPNLLTSIYTPHGTVIKRPMNLIRKVEAPQDLRVPSYCMVGQVKAGQAGQGR